MSLRGRMFWSVAAPLVILFLVVALAAEQWFRTRLVGAWQGEALPRAILAADLLDARLRTIATGVLTLAGTLGMQGQGREVLAAWLERDPLLVRVAYLEGDGDGALRAAFRGAGEGDWQAAAGSDLTPWLRDLADRAVDLPGPAWVLPRERPREGPPVAWILVPVAGEGPSAWLAAAVDLSALPEEAPAPLRAMRFTVLGPDGLFITHRDPSLVLRGSLLDLARDWQWPELTELDRLLRSGDAGVVRLARFAHQEPHWVFFAPMGSTGWTFAAAVPEGEALAAQRALLAEGGGVLVAVLGATLILVLLVAGVLARPLGRLTTTLAQVVGLDPRGDEVGVVAGAVREMGRRLEALQAARERLAEERDAAESRRLEAEAARAGRDARVRVLEDEVAALVQERDRLGRAEVERRRERDAAVTEGERLAAERDGARARLEEVAARLAVDGGVESALLAQCHRLQYGGGGLVRHAQWGACCRGEPAAARLFWDRAAGPEGRWWVLAGSIAAAPGSVLAQLLVLRLYLLQQAHGEDDPLPFLNRALDWWRQGHGGDVLPDLALLIHGDGGWRFAATRALDLYLVGADGGVEPSRERYASDGLGRRSGQAGAGERVVVPITGQVHKGEVDEALRVLLTTHATLAPGPLAEMVADSLVGMGDNPAACCLVLGGGPRLGLPAADPVPRAGALQRLSRALRRPGASAD